jgi:hypothetical protein
MAKSDRRGSKTQRAAALGKKGENELPEEALEKVTGGIENPTTVGSATGGAGAGRA